MAGARLPNTLNAEDAPPPPAYNTRQSIEELARTVATTLAAGDARFSLGLRERNPESSSDDEYPTPSTRERRRFVNRLPQVDLKDFPNETTCHICMDSFGGTEDPESPVQLPCGHVMGRKCISRWLGTNDSCPLCRRVLFGQENPSRIAGFVAQYFAVTREEAAVERGLRHIERKGGPWASSSSGRAELLELRRDNEVLAEDMRYFIVCKILTAVLGFEY